MRPILFLDIDGVLNHGYDPRRSVDDSGFDYFDEQCVKHFHTILDACNPIIILSSAWRLCDPLPWIEKRFRFHGARGDIRFKTPEKEHRILEIEESLNRLPFRKKKWNGRFAIIDDRPLFGEDFEPNTNQSAILNHLVKTEIQRGITADDAQRVIHLLEN